MRRTWLKINVNWCNIKFSTSSANRNEALKWHARYTTIFSDKLVMVGQVLGFFLRFFFFYVWSSSVGCRYVYPTMRTMRITYTLNNHCVLYIFDATTLLARNSTPFEGLFVSILCRYWLDSMYCARCQFERRYLYATLLWI